MTDEVKKSPLETGEIEAIMPDDRIFMEGHPRLFGEGPWLANRTNMAWGFEVGKGWMPLLMDLFSKIHKLLVERDMHIEIVQVKEKYASLRVYYNPTGVDRETDDLIEKMIDEAEEMSTKTCQDCGQPGTEKTNGGWLATLCDPCEFNRQERKRIAREKWEEKTKQKKSET